MRAGVTTATGTSGQSHIKARFEEFGWAAVLNTEHDLGTDLWISPRDPRRFDQGTILGAQVKNGESWFSEVGEKDGLRGWWHRNDRVHFDHWMRHAVPHILVLRRPTTQQAYWAHVTRDTVEWTGKNGKIFVPEGHLLDASALGALMDIAAAAKPAPRWAGSAWAGAHDLAPTEALRYALLVPRLVAPHPNARERALEAHEAIALLTAGRFRELRRFNVLDRDDSRSGWGWDFFEALLSFVTTGIVDGVRACATSATEPHEVAAASAALSAALVEEGAYDQALEAVRAPLDGDRCVPVDHAWLQVHRARCLAELGDPAAAITIAAEVQGLPSMLPEDVTAAAIAGSGAALMFRTSGPFGGDVATTVTASDTESSWWRSQAMSWGLGSVFDESFRLWTRNDNEIRFGASSPTDRLRGVSLVDGLTALHDSWCYTTSLTAKWHLMSDDLSVEAAANCLTDLRRAGDAKAVAAAVAHLLESGPAVAVREAADLVDLDRLAHTEASASLELLVRGADVLTPGAAEAAARWAMQGSAELDKWVRRVRPTFVVEYRRAELLSALLPAVSPATSASVRDLVVGLAPLADQGSARAWAEVIHAVPADQWSAAQVDGLLRRASDHWELAHAIRGVGVQRDAYCRAANDHALREGAVEALSWVGPITNVPAEAVPSLVAELSGTIRERLAEVRRGIDAGYGGVDPGRALVLINTHFPRDADWEPVLELLSEPQANGGLLVEALETIEWFADKVDVDIRERLVKAITEIAGRGHRPPVIEFNRRHDPRPAAKSALDSLAPEKRTPIDWLLVRDRRGRQKMIRALGRRAEPSDTKTLVALGADPDPRIRAAVAGALSYWVTKDVSTGTAIDTLVHMLADEGTAVARQAVGPWHEPEARVRPLAELLASHPSARVRTAASEILTATGSGGGA
jgi:hypothetical protein